MARYGSSHEFESMSEVKKCSVCSEEPKEYLYTCIQCSGASPDKATIVGRNIMTIGTQSHIYISALSATPITKISLIILEKRSSNTPLKVSTFPRHYGTTRSLTFMNETSLCDAADVNP